MRLLGAGAGAPILIALGEGPLRTKKLTERVPEYVPRTVYRHADRLVEFGLVERQVQVGVPSKVTYRLTPSGRDLYRLIGAVALSSPRRPGIGTRSEWASLALVAELWESGLITELSFGARSATELAQGQRALTYHQVVRRASLLVTAGLLQIEPGKGRLRRYGLTRRTRQRMVLIAGVSRWRARYGFAAESAGLSTAEMATVLRTALPLVHLPRAGCHLAFGIGAEPESSNPLTLWVAAGEDGALRCGSHSQGTVDGWAQGTTRTWAAAMLDSNRGRMRVGGDLRLVDLCLGHLHAHLWSAA